MRKEQRIMSPSQTFHYLPYRCSNRKCSLCFYHYPYEEEEEGEGEEEGEKE
jgi:hypothetical protein